MFLKILRENPYINHNKNCNASSGSHCNNRSNRNRNRNSSTISPGTERGWRELVHTSPLPWPRWQGKWSILPWLQRWLSCTSAALVMLDTSFPSFLSNIQNYRYSKFSSVFVSTVCFCPALTCVFTGFADILYHSYSCGLIVMKLKRITQVQDSEFPLRTIVTVKWPKCFPKRSIACWMHSSSSYIFDNSSSASCFCLSIS